tara:strand:- start:444131 stop:445528 length:1398 start_codon:yes stop_codon:yes gene_type:complete
MSKGSTVLAAFKTEWLTKLSLAVALLLLCVISYVTYNSTTQFVASSRLVNHTQIVIKQINQLLLEIKDAEAGQRGYLMTREKKFLKAYQDISLRVPSEIFLLNKLVSDNSAQQDAAFAFNGLIGQMMHQLRLGLIKQQAQENGLNETNFIVMNANERLQLMSEIRQQADRMISEEELLLYRRAGIVAAKAMATKTWILLGNIFATILLLFAFIVILYEIEQRKKIQRAIEKSAAQLELTNKELESFSYSVSHDLRSPLRAIDGYSRIFEEDYQATLDDEGRRLLAVIRTSSKKMGVLIDDLLAFSQMGRKRVEPTKVDMNKLVEETWSEVCHHAGKDDLVLEKSSLPAIFGDRALLRQVLVNLLSNAVKYSGNQAESKIEVAAVVKGHEIVYSVRDNGVGFDMRFYDKLFGVFQRLHTEQEFPGTGVGLAIAHRVIVRHGGRIWAESILGEGTVFYFSLPKEVRA